MLYSDVPPSELGQPDENRAPTPLSYPYKRTGNKYLSGLGEAEERAAPLFPDTSGREKQRGSGWGLGVHTKLRALDAKQVTLPKTGHLPGMEATSSLGSLGG